MNRSIGSVPKHGRPSSYLSNLVKFVGQSRFCLEFVLFCALVSRKRKRIKNFTLMDDVLSLLLVFGTPLTAILSFAYIKSKRIDLEKAIALQKSHDPQELSALKAENLQLKARIENLESIFSEVDIDGLHLKQTDNKQERLGE
jgi:hypothetical protein